LRQKPIGDYHKDYAISTCLYFIFLEIAVKNNGPDRVIKECFSAISEIIGVIERCRINGIYSDQQAMTNAAILLTNFAEAIFPNQAYKAAYWNNAAAVRFYQQHWMPYEKYMVQNGFWDPQPAAKSVDDMSAKEMLDAIRNNPDPAPVPSEQSVKWEKYAEDNKKWDRIGCLIWIIVPIVAVIIKSIFTGGK
jgi:hypothetical protein